MSQPIKVDASLFLAIESFYADQQLALSGVEKYLRSNCVLADAFGLLLSGLKPQYDAGREKATTVMHTIEESIGALRSNVVDYQHDVEEQEKAVQAQTDALRKQAEDIAAAAAAAAASVASSGGGYRTPGGDGGRAPYSGPSGSVTPPVTAVAPAAPSAPVAPVAPVAPAAGVTTTTTINAGEGSTVTVIDGNGNVVAHHNAGTPDPTPTPTPTLTPTPVPPSSPAVSAPGTSTHAAPATPDPTSVAPPAPASATPLDPAALASQNAHHAALYDQLWKDQAAVDPLGRSASELRLAWEARESVALDPASVGGTAIGFGAAADPLVTIPVNFSPMAFDPVIPAIVQPPILAGAFA